MVSYRFNLGISCINLHVSRWFSFIISMLLMALFPFLPLSPHDHRRGRPFFTVTCLTAPFCNRSRRVQRYEEAGRHILDALTLQNSDAVGDPRGGVTSGALWDSLESVCAKMGRLDLMGTCSERDLDGEYLLVGFLPRLRCAGPAAYRACPTGLRARFEAATLSG